MVSAVFRLLLFRKKLKLDLCAKIQFLSDSNNLNSNKDSGTAGRLILEPAFGVDFKTKDPKTAIYMSVGYNMQGISYREWDLHPNVVGTSAGDVMRNGLAGQLSFRVGFKF